MVNSYIKNLKTDKLNFRKSACQMFESFKLQVMLVNKSSKKGYSFCYNHLCF